MQSQRFSQFLEVIHSQSDLLIFIEFLQQLFPWVSVDISQIRWAIDKISSLLYAAHNECEGFVELVRGTPNRPRCSWSVLLYGPNHGHNTTVRLNTKLLNFILEVFSIARPELVITEHECRSSSHLNGVYDACWVLKYERRNEPEDSYPPGMPMYTDLPPLVDETCVFVHMECPQGQGHLPIADRNVIIKMRVVPMPDDDPPSFCSDSMSSVSNIQATVLETSGIQGTVVPATRQNAVCFFSNKKAEAERAFADTRQNAIRFLMTEDAHLHTRTSEAVHCNDHRWHNLMKRGVKLSGSALMDLNKVGNFIIISVSYQTRNP